MDANRFKVIVQANNDDSRATSFVVLLEVIGFPDNDQAQAFAEQLTQMVTDANSPK